MKKHLLPCLAALFLLLTACGVGHMGVHALEDITDADIVANEMGYSAVLWQSYSDTFSCEASWESFRGVEYLWTLPGNEARTVHVTYAEQECGDYRVVEPDISVVCDHDKLDEHGCKGAPDLVVEILSPSTQRHDRLVKLDLYQRAGVREYWIVSPNEKAVQVFLLDGGLMQPHEVYGKEDIAKVNVLEGCFIELSKLFSE